MLKWIIFKKMFYNLGKTITTSKNFQENVLQLRKNYNNF